MSKKEETSYWPHMILGFLAIGITLGYWTVSSAISMPVQKSNEFQMIYQRVDMNINDIKDAQERFDAKYNLKLLDFKKSDFKPNKFSKRKHGDIYAASKENQLSYQLTNKDGTPVTDANATLLITRPHTIKNDQELLLEGNKDGIYKSPNFELADPGRYLFRLKVEKGDAIGYLANEAYLKQN